METSVLPDGIVMILHVNPSSFEIKYDKIIDRVQTRGGFVESHWGESPSTIDIQATTGAFIRPTTGLSAITGGPGAIDTGGTRRESIAYDKFLDFLALYKNNGQVYDSNGNIVFSGAIRITYHGSSYLGWFSSFTHSEEASAPFRFSISASFVVKKETRRIRSVARFNNLAAAVRSRPLSGTLDPLLGAPDLITGSETA